MNRKIIFLFFFDLFSPNLENETPTTQKNFSTLDIEYFEAIKQIELYQKDLHNLQNNFTAFKKDVKDDIHELKEDLRQAKNKKLSPWIKGVIVLTGFLVIFLIFWFARIYYQLFWT